MRMTTGPSRPPGPGTTEDPVRTENMRLRAELTVLQARTAALGEQLGQSQAAEAATSAKLDGVLRSGTWRLALRLGHAAERVPAPLRRLASARRRPPADAPAAPEPAPEPAQPAIPSHAQAYGLFTQDDASLAANPCFAGCTPRVSIVILNWNRGEMTLACIRYVLRHTAGAACEIIVADNGSDPADLAVLTASTLPFQVIAMGRNLYFGEANNVAAERARGEYLFFLNNDAFVHHGWLPPLIDALEQVPHAGAAGSQLRYPDGRLQEAGSLMAPNGTAHQIGKQEDAADPRFNALRPVDYVSAAAMLVRRADFAAVLGFELCYEPAYYEDVDLCMKLRSRGQAIVYCPASHVTHVENATSQDPRNDLALDAIILANRFTFVSRWGRFLLGHPAPPLADAPPYRPAPSGRPRVALHAAAMLAPGGGVRTLLGVGAALAAVADVTLVTRAPCSAARLRRVGSDLGVDVSAIALATEASAPAPFDAAFGEAPPAGLARRATGLGRLTCGPPVRRRAPAPKLRRILSVGRFSAGPDGHRQDAMVAAFRDLVAGTPDCELHLAGALRPEPEHRSFYLAVIAAAEGLPVTLHPNASPASLDMLYGGSSLYWHLAGEGHHGIAAVEAMTAGCVPVGWRQGGLAALLGDGQAGCMVDDLAGLVSASRALLADAAARAGLADRAMAAAARFDGAAFADEVRSLAGLPP